MPPFAFGALLERPPIVLEAQIIEIQAAKRQHPLAAGRIETPEGLIVIRVVVEHAGVRGTGTRGETIHAPIRSEEHTSALQSLMRITYAVFSLEHKSDIHSHSKH